MSPPCHRSPERDDHTPSLHSTERERVCVCVCVCVRVREEGGINVWEGSGCVISTYMYTGS